ncbi:DUF2487 family protein [Lihuaxuella thermophila]|uniref:DUF2487 family protein n=1 Tax=Lihuaxuella thermophila TaxID=1173111 RepID=A0A1H8FBI7_9BACL|nr:DUF2487 family protein [Lihuaxuella thermophila]SEN28408.1 Protein of unknown function [Lihuaxuella thermophila]
MRLNTMDMDQWSQYAPYVDTLCLPIYPLRIKDKQIEIQRGQVVERVASLVEKQLTGRLLLLPSITYVGQEEAFFAYVTEIVQDLAGSGFYHLVLVTDGEVHALCEKVRAETSAPPMQIISHGVQTATILTDEQIEQEAGIIYQRIIDMWQN